MTRERMWGVCGAVLVLLLAGCGGSRTTAEERELRAAGGKGDIVIAMVWPWEARKEILFGPGADLAVEEINRSGGVNGRMLRLRKEDDHESVNEGVMIAQRLAEDPEVVAVVGHLQSYVTLPAAAIYSLAGMVMVVPATTSPELTTKGYSRLFRVIFTDEDTGRLMADYAAQRGMRRVPIYYVRNPYGRALAAAFEERAASLGISVVARASYDTDADSANVNFDSVLRDWKQTGIDGIFVAGQVPLAGTLIRKIRAQGIDVPILGSDAMSSPALVSAGGTAVESTVVPVPFHPDEDRPEVQRFTRLFERRYGKKPDPGSALGYDAINLLAQAMRRAKSAAPSRVAETLHQGGAWPGVTGTLTFAGNGDLRISRMVKTTVRGGEFRYLAESLVSRDHAAR